ncbi:MAG TPA: FAD-dependent oxidoreductase [Magnetospirillaceae bacterium]|nr:FAD-dependent oxidoreductase [Magnetospirillaceae bacterium]
MEPDKELIIIGAGGAGLGAAQYAARANLRTLLFEELAPGGQALVIDRLENYPGIAEPVTGFEFADIMRRQAEGFGAEIQSSGVSSLRKDADRFILETSEGTVSSWAVILATGARHRHLDVPGEAELAGKGVSYCATCDGPFFRDRRILVVGGGDAACDEAMFLSKLTDRVVMVHRKDRFRAQKALARRVLDNPRIDARLLHAVKAIHGGQKVEAVTLMRTDTGLEYREETDAVFIFVGSLPQSSLATGAVKDESGYILTNERMETSIPGLYAVGDVRLTPFRQLITAVADGAVAAHSAGRYIDEIRGQAYR